ncbi:hypothetical protein [Paenibacillus oleatilyticus]|uniref:Uncharacterized protein n=1 Tax=Paenibacillus oleatilyticus TaxID=2594886 RepID=A0ABV4UZP1_9BACL
MLTIRLTPQLHNVVHVLKNNDLEKNAIPSLKNSTLYASESRAAIKTFKQSSRMNLQEQNEPKHVPWD